MSTSRFDRLIERARSSPDYWKRGANLGFVYGIDRLLGLAGKKRAYLAEKTGMEESTVSRALSGRQNLTIATMDRLAEALDSAVHIHVEKRDVRGGWVPLEEMIPAATKDAKGPTEFSAADAWGETNSEAVKQSSAPRPVSASANFARSNA